MGENRRNILSRKFLLRLHSYAGLSAGLLFCLLGITGSFLVFYEELDRKLRAYPEVRPDPARKISLEALAHIVQQRFPASVLNSVSLPVALEDPVVFAIRAGDRDLT